jgi:SAM-dependent methyltransferase
MRQEMLALMPFHRRFEKWWNTHLRRPLPLVRTLPAAYWKRQVVGNPHGPQKFEKLQPGSDILMKEVEELVSGPVARVLDLGCNVGRHMNVLAERGFRNLYGVDVQSEALRLMPEVFPALKGIAKVTEATFQDYLPGVEDGFFEVVFTCGATVEVVSPSFPICREMARVASRGVVLNISESGHAYPRQWEKEFARADFILTKLLRPIAAGEGATLMVFRPVASVEKEFDQDKSGRHE